MKMFDKNRHKTILVKILKNIYSNKDLRNVLGFKGGTASQDNFSSLSDVNRTYIAKIENGILISYYLTLQFFNYLK